MVAPWAVADDPAILHVELVEQGPEELPSALGVRFPPGGQDVVENDRSLGALLRRRELGPECL